MYWFHCDSVKCIEPIEWTNTANILEVMTFEWYCFFSLLFAICVLGITKIEEVNESVLCYIKSNQIKWKYGSRQTHNSVCVHFCSILLISYCIRNYIWGTHEIRIGCCEQVLHAAHIHTFDFVIDDGNNARQNVRCNVNETIWVNALGVECELCRYPIINIHEQRADIYI